MSHSDYVELRCRSAFSFLEGASNPEDLVEQAAALGYSALALADRHGVYGLPRFHRAAQPLGVKAMLGSLVDLAPGPRDNHPRSLLLLAESRRGWANLCRLLTLGHRRCAKGQAQIQWQELEEHAADLCGEVSATRAESVTRSRATRATGGVHRFRKYNI